MKLIFAILIFIFSLDTEAAPFWRKGNKTPTLPNNCETILSPPKPPKLLAAQPELETMDALRILHEDIPVLLQERKMTEQPPPWVMVLDNYLWPAMRSESKEVAVAILGPGNSGKSTLFNTVPQIYYDTKDISTPRPNSPVEISKVEFTAGRTARPVILTNEKMLRQKNRLELRFGKMEPWQSEYSSVSEGRTVVYPARTFFENVIFVDTPSFDIRGKQNAIDEVFVWADVIFYVFSGSNYKNDFNLRIMREKFKELGPRKVVLFYRVSSKISANEAYEHFHEIAHEIFPGSEDDATTKLPEAILGTYIMTESEKIAEKASSPKFISMNRSPEFASLLADLEERYEGYRSGALNASLDHVLEGVTNSMKGLQKNSEEIEITERAFDLLLLQTVRQVVGVFPYHRLSQQAEEHWYSRVYGLRNLARWIGRPHTQFRRKHPDFTIDKAVLADLDAYSNSVVERAVSNFMLAASRGKIELKSDTPDFEKFSNELEEFRIAHDLGPDDPPRLVKTEDGQYDFFISRSSHVREKLADYQARDWNKITRDVKKEARDSLSQITAQMQSEIQFVAHQQVMQQKMSSRVAQKLYPLIAVTPFIATVGYLIYSPEMTVTEFRGLLAIIGSMVFANIVVKLDENSIRKGWAQVIDNWYGLRQSPRLIDILKRHLRFRPAPTVSPQSVWALERIQMATESLSLYPHSLLPDSPDEPPQLQPRLVIPRNEDLE